MSPGDEMQRPLRNEIEARLKEQGYHLIEVAGDDLFFSLDVEVNPSERHRLDWLDEDVTPADIIILSATNPGKLGDGWKVGRMLRVRMTEIATRPQPARSFPIPGGIPTTHELEGMSEADRQTFLDHLSSDPTPEQKLEMNLIAMRTLERLTV